MLVGRLTCLERAISYEYTFSRYTISTHMYSRASLAVYAKSDDAKHLFLETTCSILSLSVIEINISFD